MVDFTAMEWAAGMIVLLALVGTTYWLIALVPQRPLMRCPKTGAVTFVDVSATAFSDGRTPGLTVRNCDLWPEQKDCRHGCLVRYGEATSGFRIDLHALRRFEQQ